MIRTATKVEDDPQNDETGDGYDFDRCEYEFAFAVHACGG
jgi:hypothetical protein